MIADMALQKEYQLVIQTTGSKKAREIQEQE